MVYRGKCIYQLAEISLSKGGQGWAHFMGGFLGALFAPQAQAAPITA